MFVFATALADRHGHASLQIPLSAYHLVGFNYKFEKGELWNHPLFQGSVSSAKISRHALPLFTSVTVSVAPRMKTNPFRYLLCEVRLEFIHSIISQEGVLRLWGAAAKKEMSWRTQHKVKSVTCLTCHSEPGFKLWRIIPLGRGSSNVLTGTAPSRRWHFLSPHCTDSWQYVSLTLNVFCLGQTRSNKKRLVLYCCVSVPVSAILSVTSHVILSLSLPLSLS